MVNTNRIKPPIAPIGLEYLAEAVSAGGHHVELLDLCWTDDEEAAVAHFFAETMCDLVGVTVRNTDDCSFSTRQSFLGEAADVVGAIRARTGSPIVMGGVGFSVMPELILEVCGADFGVWGDGEFTLVQVVDRMEKEQDWRDLPNLIFRREGGWHRNEVSHRSLVNLPKMSRRWVDNQRYFREGGQLGIETKRGCPGRCVYCADPLAKGRRVRTRPPTAVADELVGLLEQGIDHIHTCDSEFNLPESHALEVCAEIVRRGLGERLRWYAYCSPVPFSSELAEVMRHAGCVGINFGVDNGDERMLKNLGRDFAPHDILNAVRLCKDSGMAVMLDLLLGSPGETKRSIVQTIELMKRTEPDLVGVALGVRVYPGTRLADLVTQKPHRNGLIGGDGLLDPVFFLEPSVAPFAFELLDRLIGDDRRFFFFDPLRPDRNYNYNANERLANAIREGHRGAYWDILRTYE
jgi:radical SAM superfamily enzyme YgiQ (UPF0313 family)